MKNGRNTAGQFTTGNAGRPRGSRNKATLAIECLLEGQAEALTQTAISRALAGDIAALRLCLERVVPVAKDRPINFSIGKSVSGVDILGTAKSILNAAADGAITPIEASRAIGIVESYKRIFETSELEARISVLEAIHEKED